MKAISRFFTAIKKFFAGEDGRADAFFTALVKYVPEAFPLIELVAMFTPTTIDDAALATVRNLYPKLFDPALTVEEKKLYLLAVSAELLKQKNPELSTTAARIIIQVAYALKKLGERLS